ncbi:MAG: PQQ-like beta-propeller repeat protein [Bacteroidetes bacterium]|nr:PQQ-like beta-propeller repeat protein [Bacteroidota bacterium]
MSFIFRALFITGFVIQFVEIQAQTIAQWRGPERKGVYAETGLLTSWPEEGPKLLWSVDSLGNGYGSPVFTSDRFYITGEKDSINWLYAYDLRGKLIWKTPCGKEWVATYPGSRSAPTVTDDLIYVVSGLGNLYCIDAKTGARKWSKEMIKEFHGRLPMHGHSESPVVEGDLVFLVPGGKDTNVVAMNRFTGKIAWICKGKGEGSAYNSPVMIKLPSRNILATFTSYSLLGIDASTGELLWSDEQVNVPVAERKPGMGDTHSNSIWYEDGVIYYLAGDGNGAVKLELSNDGSRISQRWRIPGMDNYMGGFIKMGNFIYSCAFERKDLRSIDVTSGQEADSLKVGRGCMIEAENLLYYYNLKGEVNLIKPDGKKMEKISSFKVMAGTKEHFAHPVIDKGILYVRHGNMLLAYDIRKSKTF